MEELEDASGWGTCWHSDLSEYICCKSLLREDGNENHLTWSLETETASSTGCSGWVGGRNHDHQSSCSWSCCRELESLEEEEARISVVLQLTKTMRKSERHLEFSS